MTLRKTFMMAAGASLLTMGLPALAQETQPTPPEVPSNPTPTEAPPPPAPPETPAPPMQPPAQSEGMVVPAPGKMSGAALAQVADPATTGQMPANPAPGTMPGAQSTTAAYPPPAPQAVYPPCTATLQDQCTQSSAREADYKGGPPANRRRPRRR